MKVVFLISSLNSGGAERVAATLCNFWVQRGDEVRLIPTYSGGGNPFYDLHEDIDLVYLSNAVGDAGRGRYFSRIWMLRHLINEFKPDVVISFLPNVNVAAIVATLFTKTPLIICERSDPSVQPLPGIWRLACSLLYRFSSVLAVQTNAVAKSIGQVYRHLPNVVVIPNPLPSEVELFDAELNRTRDRRILLSLGRLSKEKRVDTIVESFWKVAHQFGDWDLHIAGSGPEEHRLREIVSRLNLEGRIFFKGPVDRPWEVMESADAFVMNSEYEGFPNALLEAMAVGLPCIASNCRSGPSDISVGGQFALLVDPSNPAELHQAMRKILGDSAFRFELGQRARKSVRDRYALSSIAKIWDEVIQKIARRKS